MKKNLSRFFVALLGVASAGVVGTLLGSNNNVIETKAEASSTYNYASSLAGWWSEKGGNSGQTVSDGKTTINFTEAGTAYCTVNPPAAGKEYKITFVGKASGEGDISVNFFVFDSWSLISGLKFTAEETSLSINYTWPSDKAIGFCLQRGGGFSTTLELSSLTFEEIVPHTLTYINSIDYASSTSYWRGDVSLTDDGIKMSRAESDSTLTYYVGGEDSGIISLEKGKTYTIYLEAKASNMYANFAINDPWQLLQETWVNGLKLQEWKFTITPDKDISSPLVFQLTSGSGDIYIKNFYVGEVVSSSTFNDGDKLGTLPEVPTKAGYKDGKWNIGNELISSETEFTYGKDTYAYLTYTDATKEYASNFLTTLTCDDTGSITAEEGYWDNLKAEYAKLDDTSKAKLKDSKANTGGSEIQKCVARYDYVVNKYNLENFMNRGTASSSSSNMINTGSTNTTLIAAILVSATLIAGASLIVIRKKRA